MSRLLAAFALLVFVSPAFADDKDKPKPNTLTPKEIAEGWVLLFDGETTFGWKIDGAAEVKDGVLILGKGKKTVAHPTTHFGYFRVELEWKGDMTISFADWQNSMSTIGIKDGWGDIFHFRDETGSGIGYSLNGTATAKDRIEPRAELRGAPFVIETDGQKEVRITNVKLRPDPDVARPVFTGKNLDGWKINAADPKRMASKWEVTRDGELFLKNGPGDLVTEKEFDNFVLQLECKTNGKALNSGVFFRCIPGQYQNGYEAQIHNGFKGDDRTKPTDYGTGAIYRRVAARKVVSDDNAWFTMTVVADGRHFATWVNGYQTVDWTDDRKENENPRQGYRAAKGPLSLQGHDPTTDLLFRNIRIADRPAAQK